MGGRALRLKCGQREAPIQAPGLQSPARPAGQGGMSGEKQARQACGEAAPQRG